MAMLNSLDPLHFPLHGSRLIEASAGTGKTYTIAALYVRLVLQHGGPEQAPAQPLLPEQILVVTFTEAATEELRDRIRGRLSEAARAFRRQSQTSDPFLAQLLASYSDQQRWPEFAARLEFAAQSMDQAAVHTIHGWCYRMLREHAFATGNLFTQQLNTDTQQQWLLLARDYWRNTLQALGTEQLPVYQRLQQRWRSPERLFKQLQPLLTMPTIAAPCDDAVRLAQQYLAAETALRQQQQQLPWQQWCEQARTACQLAWQQKRVDGRKFAQRFVLSWLEQITQWADSLAEPQAAAWPALTETAWQRLQPEGIAQVVKGAQNALLELPLWSALEQLQQAKQALPDDQWPALQAAAYWLQQRFEQWQQQRAEIGFDDMLKRLLHALRGPQGARLAELIRAQFPLVMIDEFQDTDPVQYEIFDRIYRLQQPWPETGILLIGDPKQAIYSFRNADIYTYLRARQATAPRHYTLAVNYRSSASLVKATNQVFLAANDYPQGAFLFRQADHDPVPFVDVGAHDTKRQWQQQGQALPPLQWLLLAADAGGQKAAQVQQRLAEHCAAHMVTLLKQADTGFVNAQGELQQLQPGDIAVLVNSAFEARLIRTAMARRGLASVYLSERDSVFAGSVARDLLLLLRACANPGDLGLLRCALGTELLHLSLAELEQLQLDEQRWQQRVEQFMAYQQRWQQQGVLAMLQRLLHDFAVPQRLLSGVEQGERQLTDALHVAELLQAQAQRVEGFAGLLRYLDEHIENCRQAGQRTDSQEQQLRLESEQRLVQVVTIHKAKGLQYPVVYLPFISYCKQAHRRNPLPARYHDADGQLQLCHDKDHPSYDQVDEERLAEDIRKLYVALTRAQYATFVGVADFATAVDSAWYYLLFGRQRLAKGETVSVRFQPLCEQRQWPYVLLQGAADQQRYQPPPSPATPLQSCQRPLLSSFQPWWVASYSALLQPQQALVINQQPDEPALNNLLEDVWSERQLARTTFVQTPPRAPLPGSIHALPKGAQVGSQLHQWFEWAAAHDFATVAADQALQRQLLQQAWPLRSADDREHQLLLPYLSKWLQQPLPLPGTSPTEAPQAVCLAALKVYQAEPEFWLPVAALDAQQLDDAISATVLPQQPRPRLAPQRLQGMLKGFIDLLFEYQGRYYVLDYKSNYLGADDQAYQPAALEQAMLEHRYDVQYVLYLVALHRLLQQRLGADYDYDQHIGGALYLFLRGVGAPGAGVYHDRPPRQLIEQLAAQLIGVVAVEEAS